MIVKKFAVKRHYISAGTGKTIVYLKPCYETYRSDGKLDSIGYMDSKQKRVFIQEGKVTSIRTPSRYEQFCTQCKQPLRLP